MDILGEMDENQRQFDSNEINESEYNERRKSLLNRLVAGPNETEKTNSRGKLHVWPNLVIYWSRN